tara:strand:+ start:206 stop:580 length:375 start_codon:yes stop_codon:yes gene_type:complete
MTTYDQSQPAQNQQQMPAGQTPAQQPSQTQGPEDTLRDGNLKATIWRQQGKERDFFTTSFAKTYTDKEGNLKDTQNFGKKDLLGIGELARRSNTRVSELDREAFRRQRSQGAAQQRTQTRSRGQ